MRLFINIIKGIVIGIANAIPGVSGGTMMVSMGIYDEIIGCVTKLFSQLKKSILTLLPYGIGMAVGIVGLSYGIKFLLTNYALQTSMAFVGLILGGIPILYGHIRGKKLGISHGLVFAAFFALILVLQLLGEGNGAQADLTFGVWSCIKLFFVGIIAAATMVVPGVSGSMMLMLLGYYYPIINTITLAVDGLRNADFGQILEAAGVIIPMGLGVVLGIFVIAKIIEYLLNNYEGHTYCGILGLVIASPIAILMGIQMPVITGSVIFGSILSFAAGLIVAYFLGRE
ncbi:DUF368 domain-containing protein [Acetivibrio ethanolgignens]|uniref:DUF368 domain-containing protein n=1 Tax=Acetivibrio ethanolgignens TaxID=290052 RepID=A0A0V8QFB3_9FIRM|nr:DUF368 domain-containing protein [Acetivibrio ethanolgignens]KSV59102.1 hypothetical protein ASU35_01950 [Acetivibrio ethanolgignens]